MIESIEKVVVLGASGTVGSLSGGLIAQNGIKVCFLSRTEAGSQRGLARAIRQARSEVIAGNIICGDYENMLKSTVSEADWIIEAVTEDAAVKRSLYEKVEAYRKPDSIVSSTTSSLPLSRLIEGRSESFRRNFLSTHFYNPPGKMLACEITGTDQTGPDIVVFMSEFLEKKLRRVVIPVKDVAGFAGNRIAFVLFSHITSLVEQYGVELMDYLIGPYTGRLMPPLATLDLVGLDIHKAIINSLHDNTNDYMHDWLVLPGYVEKMIEMGLLGNKKRAGFYKKLESGKSVYFDPAMCDYIPGIEPHYPFIEKAKHFTRMGMYREAFDVIKTAQGHEADIVREILASYVAYSYSLIGEVTDQEYGINGIDRVMSFGFNWASPSIILEMLGGQSVVEELLGKSGLAVPATLQSEAKTGLEILEAAKYFVAK